MLRVRAAEGVVGSGKKIIIFKVSQPLVLLRILMEGR